MNLSFLNTGMATDMFVRLAETLLHFVWQGGVLAVIVLVVDRGLRGCSAQVRYAVHVAALLLMLACVPVTYALLERQPKDETVTALPTADTEVAVSPTAATSSSDLPVEKVPFAADEHSEVAGASPPQSPPIEQTWNRLRTVAHLVAPYAACAYLLGVALMFGRLALALMGGHRLCSEARPVTEPDLLSMVARQARKIGLRAAPVIAWCGRTSVPLVAGLIKPMILLPVALASSLAPDQLEALLAHELAHLRRFDLLVNLLQRVAEALLFFHPAVWYVSRRISSERENCCDDSVLLAGWGRVQYADALVRMAEISASLRGISGLDAAAILAAAGNNPSQFKLRILRLLGEQESLRLGVSRNVAIAILGGALIVILAIPALFSAPSLVAQNERNSLFDKVVEVKVDPKPKDDNPKEALYFRGKEALERIESVKPKWSESQNGVEFGIARIGNRSRFYSGERVPLEMFIRNTGKETVKVQLAAEFLANVPEVNNSQGEAVKVESVFAAGSVALYRETLKPGEAFGFRHLGLGLGPNPAPGKENWIPFWAEPKAGYATLRHTHEIGVEPADESKPGTKAKFTSGVIHFSIAPADEPKPPRDGVHRYVPNPRQKDVVMEQNYKDGQLHGPTRWFVRGELSREQNYKEGKLDGFVRTYEKGKLVEEGFWKEGKIDGFKRLYEDGKLVGETFYKDGQPEGAAFVRSSAYKMNGKYLKGEPEGAWSSERVGEWKLTANYKNGLLDGLWERRTSDGKVIRLTYDQGQLVDQGDDVKSFAFLKKSLLLAKDGDRFAKRVKDALQADVDLDYPGTPAAEVIADLYERFSIPMFVDSQATNVAGIGEKKIVVNRRQIPLGLGLHEMAASQGLIFDYRFHALWLTTPKSAAAWKDPTGVSDLKPAAGSPLAKALPEPPKFDLLATPIAKLAEPLQKEYGLTLDASRAPDAKWTGWRQPSLSFRDSLSILLYQNNCRCREEGGKLIIEPVRVPPKEKAEPAKEKPDAPVKAPATMESDPFEKSPKGPKKVEPAPEPQAADDPSGTWVCKVKLPRETATYTIVLKLEMGKLVGEMQTLEKEDITDYSVKDGSFKDGNLYFTIGSAKIAKGFPHKYMGKLSGDRIKGKVEASHVGKRSLFDWEAKRSKEKAEPAKEKGAGLRINVPALGPTPLAFDFAFPVTSKSTDQKQSFCFLFGVLRQ